ncbi:MAG: hypothetical protein MUF01_18730, partial [Bryobacterales bacterium]|nr:hypothetical protein [Bryobacterales bacterium]
KLQQSKQRGNHCQRSTGFLEQQAEKAASPGCESRFLKGVMHRQAEYRPRERCPHCSALPTGA